MKRNKVQTLSDKRRRKMTAGYKQGGGDSMYARKRAYCLKNGVWVFEVPDPKPWKKAK